MDTSGRNAIDRILYDEHRKAYYALKYVNYDLLNPQNINL